MPDMARTNRRSLPTMVDCIPEYMFKNAWRNYFSSTLSKLFSLEAVQFRFDVFDDRVIRLYYLGSSMRISKAKAFNTHGLLGGDIFVKDTSDKLIKRSRNHSLLCLQPTNSQNKSQYAKKFLLSKRRDCRRILVCGAQPLSKWRVRNLEKRR